MHACMHLYKCMHAQLQRGCMHEGVESVGLSDFECFVAERMHVEEKLKRETSLAVVCKLKREVIVRNAQHKSAPIKATTQTLNPKP